MGLLLYWPLSVLCVFACMCVCVCVCVCLILNQSTSKKPHVSDLSKLDTLLHETRITVLRLEKGQLSGRKDNSGLRGKIKNR